MTFGAFKPAMHGLIEGGFVNVSRHAFLTVTGQAVFFGNCGSRYHETGDEDNQEGSNHVSNIAEN
jgi:hypothetical protein